MVPTGGEARWEVEELLQELADGEPGGHVMEAAGTTAEKKGSAGGSGGAELTPMLAVTSLHGGAALQEGMGEELVCKTRTGEKVPQQLQSPACLH